MPQPALGFIVLPPSWAPPSPELRLASLVPEAPALAASGSAVPDAPPSLTPETAPLALTLPEASLPAVLPTPDEAEGVVPEFPEGVPVVLVPVGAPLPPAALLCTAALGALPWLEQPRNAHTAITPSPRIANYSFSTNRQSTMAGEHHGQIDTFTITTVHPVTKVDDGSVPYEPYVPFPLR
jgi:hypothetical protein